MRIVSYVFRNKILFHSGVSITDEIAKGKAYLLDRQEPDGPVVMISKDWVGNLILCGENFPSPEAAIEAGRTWRQHLTVALARAGIGANLGSDSNPWFPESFERAAAEGKEGVAVEDSGLIVYEAGVKIVLGLNTPKNPWDPRPSAFSQTEPEKRPLELLSGPIFDVSAQAYALTKRQELAYNLLHSSFFESNPETKTITLVTAVEAMIIQSHRSVEVVTTLDILRDDVSNETNLSEGGKTLILNALGNAKQQSITEAGRSLARQFLNNTYDGLPPDDFFKRSYDDRCKLVHGSTKRPTTKLLRDRNPILAKFVADLLDASVFGSRLETNTE